VLFWALLALLGSAISPLDDDIQQEALTQQKIFVCVHSSKKAPPTGHVPKALIIATRIPAHSLVRGFEHPAEAELAATQAPSFPSKIDRAPPSVFSL
jgi:hypothetical protein